MDQESYERAYAQHREAHGPGGYRVTPRHAEDEQAAKALEAALNHHWKLAQLGARAVEILREVYVMPLSFEPSPDSPEPWERLLASARSLGLLGEQKEESRG